MADGMEQAGIFEPKRWNYGEPATAAALDTVGNLWQAAMSKPPQPDIPSCEQCSLVRLIALAHKEREQRSSRIKGGDTGIEGAPGDFI
ncbi:MAG: hypothetical protein C4310_13375 [Chloroflexota bacterium]